MKKGLILLLVLLVIGCNGGVEETTEETPTVETSSRCDRISDLSRRLVCEAMETADMNLCREIPKDIFREECLMVFAELVQDETFLSNCALSEVSNNRIICESLIMKDADHCFVMQEDLGISSSLSLRDCVDLVARKLKDPNVCELFETRKQNFFDICGGATSDCEGLWIDGAPYNVEDCKGNF